MIKVEDITKLYNMGAVKVSALRGVSLAIERGEVVSIMGPSGSGKSTLMNILGCLDKPTTGRYLLDGEEVGALDDDALAAIRNRKIGFVFQTFNLLSRTTAYSNVELPLLYGKRDQGQREHVKAVLEAVGLADRMHHRPNELSGGEQQRVAIARALINDPVIMLADEPTGNLDSKTGAEILDLLLGLNRERGLTLILVTHDPKIAARSGRVVRLQDGMIENHEGAANGMGHGATPDLSAAKGGKP